MNNNISSLYSLIKQKSQEKGRPLKVICDWDECLQPSKPVLLWELSPKKISFKEYFEKFWNKASMKYYESGFGTKENISWGNYSYIDPDDENEKINRRNLLDDTKRRNDKFYQSSAFYDLNPFLSIAEELLQCLKDGDLISDLWIMTAFKKGKHPSTGNPKKAEKFKKTFGNFPNTKLYAIEVTPDPRHRGKYSPYRWEYIKEKKLDFDIFIDDNATVLTKTRDFFNNSDTKKFILPAYKTNEKIQGENIYHLKTTVSDLKNQDFVVAALELKTKKLEQEIKTAAAKNSIPFWWIILLGAVIFLGLVVLLITNRIKKKK